jgi:hypothetical protein
MHNGATKPWSKSNSPSLRRTQGVSISCPDLLPDLWELADDFSTALDELLEYAA